MEFTLKGIHQRNFIKDYFNGNYIYFKGNDKFLDKNV